VITAKIVSRTRSTRPAAISARFNDRPPCERNGTSDVSLSRATISTASSLSTVEPAQSRGPSSVLDTTVSGMVLIRAFNGSSFDASVLGPSNCTNCRQVSAARTSRCSSL
jgi:hypothetical protein